MNLDRIKTTVETITNHKIDKTSRDRHLVYARAIFFKLAKQHTRHTLYKIGATVGRHHATVIHGIKIFDDIITRYESEYYKMYLDIDKNIRRTSGQKYNNPMLFYRDKYAQTLIKARDLQRENRELKRQLINNLL